MTLKSNWLPDYISLLDRYVQELKKSPDKKIILRNGIRISAQPALTQYKFKSPEGLSFGEEAQPTLLIQGNPVEGSLVSLKPKELIIALQEDFGEKLPELTLLADSSALVQVLKERLEEVNQKKRFFNRELVERVLKGDSPRILSSIAANSPVNMLPDIHHARNDL